MDDAAAALVGRDVERALLHRTVEEARAGSARVLVLRGVAGIGKSRLLTEASRLAAAAGMPVARARAIPSDGATPFGLALGALHDLADGAGSQGPIAEAVAAMLPAPDVHATALRVVDLLQDAAEVAGGMALLLDDVQWADEGTLTTVRRVADRWWDVPMLVVLATRPVPRPPVLEGLLDPRSRLAEVVDIGPLPHDAVAALVADRLGRRPTQPLLARVAQARGNPFMVTALLDALGRTDGLRPRGCAVGLGPGAASLPESWVDPLVDGVLRDLGEDPRRVVTLACLHPMSLGLLATLLDRDPDEVARSVERALSGGLVVEAAGGVVPSHDLVRESVLRQRSAMEVAALHGRIAETLAVRQADPSTIAPHLIAAAVAADPATVAAVRRLGVSLLERQPVTALGLLERAHALGDTAAARHHLRALMLTGRLEEAARLGEGLRGRGGPGEQAHVQLVLAQVDFLRGRLRAAAQGCADAAQLLPTGPDRALARADQAVAELFTGQVSTAEEVASTVLSGLDGEGIPAVAQAHGVQLMAAALRGDDRAAAAALDALRGASRHLSADGVVIALPDLIEAMVHVWHRDTPAAQDALQRAWARITATGLGWALPMLHAVRAELLLALGRPEDAVAEAGAGATLAQQVGSPLGGALSLGQQAHAELWLGQDPAATLVRAGERCGAADGFGVDVLLRATGLAQEARGEQEQALMTLGLLLDRVDELGLQLRVVEVAPDVVRLADNVGDRARMDAVARRLTALAAGGQTRARLPARRAMVRLQGDARTALDLRQRVLALPGPLERAQVLQDVAAGLRRAGEDRRARSVEREATAMLAQAGAVLPGPALQEGGAPPVPRLSVAERRVVELVGEGWSNAQIASRLSLSRRTVESHLHNVYRRLGIGSRVELALVAPSLCGEGAQRSAT